MSGALVVGRATVPDRDVLVSVGPEGDLATVVVELWLVDAQQLTP